MKILFIALHFSEYAYCLASELSRHNKVMLILNESNTHNEIGTATPNTENLSITRLPHQKNIKTLFSNTIRITRIAKQFKPDVAHFQEVAHEYQTASMILLKKIPLILTVHDPIPHAGEDLKSFTGLVNRRAIYSKLQRTIADGLITHGDYLCEILSSTINRREKIFSVHHGPLGLLTKPTIPSGTTKPFTFLFFGRMQKYKGIELFIEAIHQLHNEGLNIQGVLAGKGPELTNSKEAIAAAPYFIIKDYFLTPEEVAETFDYSDVVVLPYIEGTQSGVAALAIGRGKPCIISKVGSLPEMVIDGKTGVLIEPNSLECLVAAMRSLYSDAQLCQIMGEQAKHLGLNAKSWHSAAAKTIGIYKKLLDEKTSTPRN